MAEKLAEPMVGKVAVPSDGKPYNITYDTEVKGFGLRVTRNGARSFILNYRCKGQERRYTIGSWPDWKVSAARTEASRLKREVDLGRDPMGDRHEDRAAPTVNELADRYLAEHASRKREGSRVEDEGLLKQWIRPELGKRKAVDVTHSDIDKLHRKITTYPTLRRPNGAPYRANRVVALLGKMFSLAVKWQYRADNPVKGIEKNPERKRTRYLQPAEVVRLAKALAEHPNKPMANAVRLLLLTGARRAEVLNATWDQFDLAAGVWTKPGATTKQKTEHRVPLNAPALQVLKEMRETADTAPGRAVKLEAEAERGETPKKRITLRHAAARERALAESPHLFPSRVHGQPLMNVRKFWDAVCKLAELKGVRIHDLRHSYASFLASAGLSLPIIGALLGHTQSQTTHRYAHLLDDPLRQATERAGAVFTAAAGGKTGEVVDFASGERRA